MTRFPTIQTAPEPCTWPAPSVDLLEPGVKELRPYQLEALETLTGATGKALIVLASGLGKTVLAAAFARRWLETHPGRILYLAHSLEILLQGRREFEVALGPSVTLGIVTHRRKENPDARVLFSMFQTMQKQRATIPRETFELVIVDEAHHGQAVTYRRVIEHFTPALVLGMTATPDRMDGRDIRELFGHPCYEYPLGAALADGWLAPVEYRVLSDNFSLAELRRLVQEAGHEGRPVSRKQLDDTLFLEERLEAMVEIIRREQTPEGKSILFCRSIEHMHQMHAYFPEARPYHCHLNERVRHTTFEAFREGRLRTILVVDKFNEGVDIPDANLVVFLRATDSRTLWLQQLGRGLRRTAGKDQVLVLDFVANCDRIAAVWELELEVTRHLGGAEKPEALVLSHPGWQFSFDEELRTLLKLLQRLEVRPYATWEEASAAARKLGARNSSEYLKLYRADPRLPGSPYQMFASEWRARNGWPGFLGVRRRCRLPEHFYATYEEASRAAQRLGLRSQQEYGQRYKEDPHLPSGPDSTYRDLWLERGRWRGFLGRPYGKYQTWQEAAEAARALGIKSSREYAKRWREDPKLPCLPAKLPAFKDEWEARGGWLGFLGEDSSAVPPRRRLRPRPPSRPRESVYPTWDEASAAVRALGFRTFSEYVAGYRQDPRLPGAPSATYVSVWKTRGNWPGFLGTSASPRRRRSEVYPSWEEASRAARALGITSAKEYRSSYREDPRLPAVPKEVYKDVFLERDGWEGFLGVLKKYRTWEDAANAARRLGIRSSEEFRRRCQEDPLLPRLPHRYFLEEWQLKGSWTGFLGLEARILYPTWEEAREAARTLGIRSAKEYAKRHHEDPRLPAEPRYRYEEVWKQRGGFSGFLGRPPGPPRKLANELYATWEEASAAARALGIRTRGEYRDRFREDSRLPGHPYALYSDVWEERGAYSGFLGTEEPLRRTRARVYATFEEASKAARSLGIRTQKQYFREYARDPRLPSQPRVTYADVWRARNEWDGFLEPDATRARRRDQVYATYDEASAAARALGIRTGDQYKREYRQDPRLPSNPNNTYTDVWKARGGWDSFLGRNRDR